MNDTIPENHWDDKICHHLNLGLLQEVLPVNLIETLLETYQMWEQRERQLNMVAMIYWLIGLHLFPHLGQQAVYARLVSGLRAFRNDVPPSIPSKSAFSYRRAQLGSEILEELFTQLAGPRATEQTPGAFWKGMRLLALDGTVESVADTPSNRESFRYSTDDEASHSPFPQARLVLVIECATRLICEAHLSSCREAETTHLRTVLSRWKWENSLVLWDSGFHCSWAILALQARKCHVLGRLRNKTLCHPSTRLCDGSYLTYIYEDQDHHRGKRTWVRVISYTFTDPRLPGAGTQVYRLVTTLLDPFTYPAKELAVLYHERWQTEIVLKEAETSMRLSARTLRSRTPGGVVQELYALLIAHLLVRLLMMRASETSEGEARQLSFTKTLRLIEDTRVPLLLVSAARRATLVSQLLREIGGYHVPKQRLRIQARVVKRSHSRYGRKKPEHFHAPPFEWDFNIYQVLELVG